VGRQPIDSFLADFATRYEILRLYMIYCILGSSVVSVFYHKPEFWPELLEKETLQKDQYIRSKTFSAYPNVGNFLYIFSICLLYISSPDKKEITIGKTKVLTAVIELSNHDEISYNPEVVITHDSSLQYEKITVLDVSIFKIFSNIAENNV
jgi:hypothetical protein